MIYVVSMALSLNLSYKFIHKVKLLPNFNGFPNEKVSLFSNAMNSAELNSRPKAFSSSSTSRLSVTPQPDLPVRDTV